MGTKEQLLGLLEENKGTFYSGEEIAERFAISRTAVWKAVKALQADGYEIDAVRNRGYRLAEDSDILSAAGIESLLRRKDLHIQVLASATSTNRLLREQANAGAPEGTVILAGSQSQGRGRLGREFFSPPETGIYLSLLLRPQGYTPSQAVRVTTMAAVAACRALEEAAGAEPRIKWVNDIFLNGRKVGGILTEGAFHLETGELTDIILGIGINVYPPKEGFPEAIRQTAGAVWPSRRPDGKNRIAAAFLDHFMACYKGQTREDYAADYRQRSMVIGKKIDVLLPTGTRQATALDVDGECRLIVRFPDGSVQALSSAEVSIRPAED